MSFDGVSGSLTVAAVQAAPAFLDRTATIEVAARHVASADAELVVFPESFVPGLTGLGVVAVPDERRRLVRPVGRTGAESGVTIQIRGDGDEWKSDISLARNGTTTQASDGFATSQGADLLAGPGPLEDLGHVAVRPATLQGDAVCCRP